MRKVNHKIVWAKFQVEGFHAWPDAPGDLAFLRSKHRHVFHFEIGVEVTESNREVEFILLGRRARHRLASLYKNQDRIFDFENDSCEMIAEKLGNALEVEFLIEAVSVFEDDENGASVWYS